jgi:AraC-like DNA-binding protein
MGITSQYNVAAAAGRGLEAYTRQLGIDLAPLATAVRLDIADFQRTDVRLDMDKFTRLLELLATVSGDDCFGLHYGQDYKLGDSGALGFAISNAPDLRTAINVYAKYISLFVEHAYFDVSIGASSGKIEWHYSPLVRKTDQFADLGLMLTCRHFQLHAGEDCAPSEIMLERSKPKSAPGHSKLLTPNVTYNSRMNRLVFPSDKLDNTNSHADARLFEIMCAQCDQYLKAIAKPKSLVPLVKEKILAVLSIGEATLPLVSKQVGIGSRSLQRHLASEGKSYEKLVEETRRELSDRLLLETDFGLAEIAHRCGYTTMSAYSRAAKAWYGRSPASYRKNRHFSAV